MTTAPRQVTATPAHEQTRSAWEAIAPGYDRFVTPTHMWLANEALRRAGLLPGMRLLDVASGSGALSLPAARLGARVLSTDIAPAMLERLAARAREERLDVETRVMDGHALDVEEDAFDVVASQFGVMLFPDLPRAAREMARVTRPGGRVLLVAYGEPAQVEFLSFFVSAIRDVVPGFNGLPMDPPPLPFQVADPAKLRGILAGTGLRQVAVETITERLEFGSGAEMWDWVVNSNPVAVALVADLSSEQRAAVRRVLDGMLHERAAGDGAAVLTNPINIGIGTK